ncbi:MAG TPA: hypothetical protein VNK51_14275 [Bradyrhizobium sp.]|nr:hypothetical protein [Bradyrhizobium sp.]
MKKLTSLTGASLAGASIMVSAGALAADLTVKAPPRPAWVDSWAGPYIGAYFGAGAGRVTESSTGSFGNTSVSTNAGVVTSSSTFRGTTASNLSGDVTGSMVDLFAGYNWQAGNIVAGGQIEGTVFSDVALKPFGNQTFNSVSTNVLLGAVTSTTAGSGTVQSNQQLRSRVGLIGRLGFLARPDLLLYGLGGLELGHFTFADSADPFGGDNNKWVAGYTVGAGGELKLTGNWSLRGEYRYLNFGFNRSAATSAAASSATGATTFVTTSSESSRRDVGVHAIRIRQSRRRHDRFDGRSFRRLQLANRQCRDGRTGRRHPVQRRHREDGRQRDNQLGFEQQRRRHLDKLGNEQHRGPAAVALERRRHRPGRLFGDSERAAVWSRRPRWVI